MLKVKSITNSNSLEIEVEDDGDCLVVSTFYSWDPRKEKRGMILHKTEAKKISKFLLEFLKPKKKKAKK